MLSCEADLTLTVSVSLQLFPLTVFLEKIGHSRGDFVVMPLQKLQYCLDTWGAGKQKSGMETGVRRDWIYFFYTFFPKNRLRRRFKLGLHCRFLDWPILYVFLYVGVN